MHRFKLIFFTLQLTLNIYHGKQLTDIPIRIFTKNVKMGSV